MTLEELQAEFPHGSRWRPRSAVVHFATTDPGVPSVDYYTVIGWADGRVYLLNHRQNSGFALAVDLRNGHVWERVSDPVPCPITEDVVILAATDSPVAKPWFIDARTQAGIPRMIDARITLHPAEPGAAEGRYTWNTDGR